MKKSALLLVPALALGVTALTGGAAFAATGDSSTSYQTELAEQNGSGASGMAMITVTGDQATVHLEASGLAEKFGEDPYPHVQHIHIGEQGICPTPDADVNGDGIVDTVEGQPSYGMIGTTLSTSGDTSPAAGTDLTVAGMGGSFTYDRTFTLNADTAAALESGTGVVVVHGLDPSTLSQEAQDAKSNLVPELPLAATSPALCGALEVSQMSEMPDGAPLTGGGSTASGPDAGMLALGGGLVLAAGGVLIARRRITARNADSL